VGISHAVSDIKSKISPARTLLNSTADVESKKVTARDAKEFLGNYLTLPWHLSLEVQKGEYSMAYKITDECTMCGTCVPECAFEAIAEGDPKYTIDADLCTDCGSCEGVCPSGAIEEG